VSSFSEEGFSFIIFSGKVSVIVFRGRVQCPCGRWNSSELLFSVEEFVVVVFNCAAHVINIITIPLACMFTHC
jgi:hypothetical protein